MRLVQLNVEITKDCKCTTILGGMRTTGHPALLGRCLIAQAAINDYNMEFYWSGYNK